MVRSARETTVRTVAAVRAEVLGVTVAAEVVRGAEAVFEVGVAGARSYGAIPQPKSPP